MTDFSAYDWHELAPRLVAEHLAETGPGAVVEIGVWRGELSQRLLALPALTSLTMVDPWRPCYGKDEFGRWVICGPGLSEQEMEEAYHAAQAVQAAHSERSRILRLPSVEAAPHILDGSLAVVIVDGLHFVEQVQEDIRAWLPKLRPGGLMIGDDYSDWFPGVQLAVESIFGPQHQVLGQTWWTFPHERSLGCCA